jgi:CubicO group peptidase (beta-lactamase class C family)
MKRFLFWLISLGIGLYALSVITDNDHVWTGLRQCYMRGYKTAQIDDMRFQSLRSIPASKTPRPWPLHSRYNQVTLPASMVDSTHRWNTTALTVIHQDSLLLDWKSDRIPGADTMRTNSFSMAKSLTAMAIGVAEKEGLLDVNDRVSQYLPRFADGPSSGLTIEQVLQMRSGIPYGESYKNPFGFMSKCTYGDDILDRLRGYTVTGAPGTPWKYQGGNTLLLHEVLLKVIDVPLGTWFAEKIWGPIGATAEAKWAVDNAGHERNYACFYSTGVEFARLGQLFLDSGQVAGNTVLERDFVRRMTAPIGALSDGTNIQHYGYQLWMGTHDGMAFKSMQGLHGQYVVWVPELELVAVRTGFFRPKDKLRDIDVDVYRTIDMAKAAARL